MEYKNNLNESAPVSPFPKRNKNLVIIISIIVLIAIGIGSYFLFNQYNELQKFKEEKDVAYLTSQVEKHMVLPAGEPLIATVNNADELRGKQPFYRNAENGDKVFIWQDKALIYRPDIDKIVDFGIIINASITPTPTSTSGTSNK